MLCCLWLFLLAFIFWIISKANIFGGEKFDGGDRRTENVVRPKGELARRPTEGLTLGGSIIMENKCVYI